MYPGLANLKRSLQRIFPDRLHSLKYLQSEPGTLAQQFHNDHPEPDRFVVFGGMKSNSALAVFNKKKKTVEIVEYKRGDILNIKSTTIHAGWLHSLKYLKSEPGTLAQQFHTDHPEPDRFVVFGGIESNSALAVFNKKKKAIEIVEYKRGDILIIKSTTIHAGWAAQDALEIAELFFQNVQNNLKVENELFFDTLGGAKVVPIYSYELKVVLYKGENSIYSLFNCTNDNHQSVDLIVLYPDLLSRSTSCSSLSAITRLSVEAKQVCSQRSQVFQKIKKFIEDNSLGLVLSEEELMFVPFCSGNTLQSQGSLMDAMIARHFIGSASLLAQSVEENAPHQTDNVGQVLLLNKMKPL
ncbi:hypothetical protein MP638_004445 [Amoeboaphelidium occidentale]|nr:hypothetical protein MP638_004445 [Amoeboaphelidium occidentale]